MPRPLTADLLRVGLACLAGVALAGSYGTFRVWQQGEIDERGTPTDAIVVLGAAHYGQTPSAVFAARLDHAVALFLHGAAPILVVTGGRADGDTTSEADVARAYAIGRGVPAAAILGETEGRDTLDSLRNVASLMRAHGLRSALFVSDRTHMLRVLTIASNLGIRAYGSPTTTSPSDRQPGARLAATAHELGALALYLTTGH